MYELLSNNTICHSRLRRAERGLRGNDKELINKYSTLFTILIDIEPLTA
jgi:hypothetical protein